MKLSPIEEYGLRCLIQLARRGPARPVSIRTIAEDEGLTTAYAGKLMFLLQRGRLVKSTRGARGGYVLARPAGELTLAQVFQALEPAELEDVCGKFTGTGSNCVHTGACAIKHVWAGLSRHIQGYLGKVTLKDLATPLGPVPTPA